MVPVSQFRDVWELIDCDLEPLCPDWDVFHVQYLHVRGLVHSDRPSPRGMRKSEGVHLVPPRATLVPD